MEKNLGSRILFEDNCLAVLYKICGEDSQDFFKPIFPQKKYAEAVNRLDKPVSGILLVAFNKTIHTKLNEEFKLNKIKKEYWAICKKLDNLAEGKKLYCRGKIIFNSKKQKAFIYSNSENGKSAELFYCLAGSGENYNFLRVFPVTGRTHQIRVQLANLGMPIKGDIKYGSKRTEKQGGIRLHSYLLEFIHPVKDEPIKIAAPPVEQDALWQACSQACLSG